MKGNLLWLQPPTKECRLRKFFEQVPNTARLAGASGREGEFKSPILSPIEANDKHTPTNLGYSKVEGVKFTLEDAETCVSKKVFELSELRIVLAVA
jgi:hypothetical protein